MASDGTNGARVGENPLIDTMASEIQAMQQMINDRPNTALSVIMKMSGKDRAILAFYLRELGYMIETADAEARG